MKSWRTSAAASTPRRRGSSRSRRGARSAPSRRAGGACRRGVGAGDERVDRQPEADDERGPTEIGQLARLVGVLARALRRQAVGDEGAVLAASPSTLTSRPTLNMSGTVPWKTTGTVAARGASTSRSVKRSPPAEWASPVTGPTTCPVSESLPVVPGELARLVRRRRAAGDRRVEQEDREKARNGESDDEPRGTALRACHEASLAGFRKRLRLRH